LSHKVCLDLACGSGRYIKALQAHQVEQLFGLDYSPEMLVQASNPKSQIPKGHDVQNPKLTRGAFLALPFAAAAFDLIICGLAVGHEKNLAGALAEISRVLRPGGMVVYSDFHPFGTLSGWQRSFTTAKGETYNLEHYLHLYSHHLSACQFAGLTITAVLEPSAGRHAPPGYQKFPVVLVIRAEKMGQGSRVTE
jgi:malonyl-CoA O-methyltransferase